MNLGALRPVIDITLLYRFLKVAAIFCPTLVYFIVAQVPAANPREEKNAMSAISQPSRPLLVDGGGGGGTVVVAVDDVFALKGTFFQHTPYSFSTMDTGTRLLSF